MKILYFAWLRNRTGCSEERVTPPAHVVSVSTLAAWIGERHPGFAEAIAAKGVVRCAVNQDYVEGDAPLGPDDEIAFFPPVTGG